MENPAESGPMVRAGIGEPDPADAGPTLATGSGSPGIADTGLTMTIGSGQGDPAIPGLTTVDSGESVESVSSFEFPSRVGRYRIRTLLGEGGFGKVYLVYDDQLERHVAVKVPHRRMIPGPEAAESYLAEARAAARLDHPNIVPVYDVGSTADFPCFIVSKLVEGPTLAEQLRDGGTWPSSADSARLVSAVAEALHHAHLRGIIHRDVKPSNILLDADGRPYVADFGLALSESGSGGGPTCMGTPAYMSPEQARGEGHRIDGRSDIFSLGIVLYELLTRRRPFRGTNVAETLRHVAEASPRPPREIDATIDRELERICLKALARRASERYPTAHDLAEDLRYYLDFEVRTDRLKVRPGTHSDGTGDRDPAESGAGSSTQGAIVKVIPRGLRPFDAADADFFLSLLPGPRDREGLPETLRFWKTGIEQADPGETFPVGLIYGPSGCGKSSLVKAGLAPRLAAHVLPIYVEATADRTEERLLAALARRCPGLPRDEGLAGALTALRRGQILPAGRKVLIVLDQFEQWLHARRGTPRGELAEALRQCDGGRVQCLVLVRDDFWMAATRFMGELEVPLVEGRNAAAVDLFPVRHAEKVLEAFGRAFGALPDEPGALSREQRLFLEQAVSGLAQEGKVICVRLALFAQMMKDRPWNPASLRGVGGAQGVGATFLEETFSAAGAPPEHRRHQEAARAILKALLPISGTDIKGHMRPEAELLEVSGYSGRPRDFEDVIHILDGEVRLITPTDPEGIVDVPAGASREAPGEPLSSAHAEPDPSPAAKSYQLAHDYLVPSLRDWLTRKQRETRRGRAELRLTERASLWGGRPENRFLPAWWEWLALRLLTHPRDWTTAQAAMMRRAARHHAARGLFLAAGLVMVAAAGREIYGRQRALVLRDRLLEAATEDVPGIVPQMAPYRRWVDGPLRRAYDEAASARDARRQLHAGLGLLPTDPGQVDFLLRRLLTAGPREAVVIRDALQPRAAEIGPWLWSVLEDGERPPGERLRAASALAAYAPDDKRWEKVGGDVAARLTAENGLVIAGWAEALRPVRQHLLPHLVPILVGEEQGAAGRPTITRLYGDYAEGLPDAFRELEAIADKETKPGRDPEEQTAQQRKRANAAVVLAALGRWERARRLLILTPDPTVRSYLIDRLGPGGARPGILENLIDAKDGDVSTRRAALLALGEFDEDRLPPSDRRTLTDRLVALYRDDPDPGIHGAAEWLLRRWGQSGRLATVHGPATGKPEGSRRWYVGAGGQTMVLVPPGSFRRAMRDDEPWLHVDRGFAIAAREVTVAEFRPFRERPEGTTDFNQTDDGPIPGVSWYEAAAYCNWLSEHEGIPRDQWCYLPNREGEYAEGMAIAPDLAHRSGYRLPTALEWEYACRAGSQTWWSSGKAYDLLPKYAWYVGNARSRLHPTGTLRPNDLGLFDMHGNAWEWCQDLPDAPGTIGTATAPIVITDSANQPMCGGAFDHGPLSIQSAHGQLIKPNFVGTDVGFRPARNAP